ncbi:hypothetical protein [Nocardia cyriacigeorgica]|nr:hypothetical protein [Nocardia cyriacigeorgica]
MREWRGRVGIAAESWQTDRFEADDVLARAGNTIERTHPNA